jgi:cytochrome c peroxidase
MKTTTIAKMSLTCLIAAALAACGGGGGDGAGSASPASANGAMEGATASEAASESALLALSASSSKGEQLGKLPVDAAVDAGEFLFKDVNLSASKQMACVTCHTENAGHADVAGTKLPMGGPSLMTSGMRSSPTTRYLNENGAFSINKAGIPSGGFTWDGRADSRKEQAGAPFFEHQEMALSGSVDEPSALTALVRAATYFPAIQALYKPKDINTDAKLFDKITTLLSLYQRDDADYNLFDSRYDQWLKQAAALTPAEMRGMALFNDVNRGNCASCHSAEGPKPLFTNFGYAALAAPRNHEGPLNANPAYFDLGLCMRERGKKESKKQAASDARYCGMFKTPTLRNIDRTAPYFHNASVTTLEAAVRFHFERDSQPAKYYRQANGTADRPYNDVPAQYLPNIARGKPFNGSYSPTDGDISDLVAFLKTLTDADQFTAVAR